MKNPYTQKVTERFVEAMYDIMDKNKRSSGKLKSVSAFARTLKVPYQSLQHILKQSKKQRRDATLANIEAIIRVHGVNPVWLFTGQGAKFSIETDEDSDLKNFVRKEFLEVKELIILSKNGVPQKKGKKQNSHA